ncbi:MAG TPA: serine hydrolase [Novosphingobium sp.]|nr:serine hydrolase [Novosphingobium sp.]
MPVYRFPHILALLALPSLWGCGSSGPAVPPPPSNEAKAAILADGGAPREELGRAIDRLFDSGAVGRTDALLVLKRGSIVAERYGGGISAKTPLPGWAMGQCVTALMIGQLVSDGRLRLNESAPVPDWQRAGDPRGEITLKQLLQMRSGLRHSESGEVAAGGAERQSDRIRMLFLDGRDDMAAYAEAQPLEAPAGQVFEESSATAVILSDLAARVLAPEGDPGTRQRAVAEYLGNRVLGPLGLSTMRVEFDRAGTMIGAAMVEASALDWGRIGEFLRHTGSVKGAQVLPRRWIQFMLEPNPRNRAYGAGVWLNRGEGDARLFPAGKSEVFACRGEHGQYVIGSPGQLLTVVRLGASDAAQEQVLRRELGSLLTLFPSN